ncbi:MAG: EndoU domain-containing protein, partial [Haemophilus parainfluenzae]|nr:EndoU domain-containing protein [Haemophilus parainfluenzae]
ALTQGDIHGAYQRLLNGENIEVVLRDLEHLSQKERAKLLADCDAACRQVVPSLLMAANDFSEEQAIALGSILSKIPAEQRSRVDILVQAENSKTLEAIENSKSDVEKHIALAVKVMRFFQAENAVSGGKPNKLKATSVHSENKDYSKDVANLGVNRNKGLNERISNRQKNHYIYEQQAAKNVHKVTVPIDFDGHILNVEINKKGKLVGGHSIANGNINFKSKGKPNSQGVYEAEIQYINPENQKVLTKKSTMFPDNWSANRVKYEVDMAYKNRKEYINPKNGKVMWESTTPSGVKVTGYKEPKVTVYPPMK